MSKTKTAAWAGKLAGLLSKYNASAADAIFRNEYKNTVDEARKNGSIDDATAEDLLRQRGVFEDSFKQRPEAALDSWIAFRDASKESLPQSLIEAFFPKRKDIKGSQEPSRWLDCTDEALIDLLVKKSAIAPKAIARLGKLEPRRLLDSSLFVVGIRQKMPIPPEVWNLLASSNERPAGGPLPQLLANWFQRTSDKSAGREILAWLIAQPEQRESFFHELQRDSRAVLKLAQYASTQWLIESKKEYFPLRSSFLRDWIVRSCAAACTNTDAAPHAVAATLLRSGLAAQLIRQGTEPRADPKVTESAIRLGTMQLKWAENGSVQRSDFLSPINAKELHELANQFLSGLPGSDSQMGDRNSRFERYLGRKEVLVEVLRAMSPATTENHLKSALETALFNLGVQPVADVGTSVPFDPVLHALDSGDAIPDDAVTVLRSGWILAGDDLPLILEKALVRRSAGE